jgi:hypothetical protein
MYMYIWKRGIIPTAHYADNPLLRQPITPTTHYSDSPYFRQQPCIAAIRYAEAACSSGTFELIHISSSVRVPRRQDLLSIVLSIVVCFPGPDVIKKILC